MRVLLDDASKKKLYLLLKKENNCGSLEELSQKLKIDKKTLDGWIYVKERYISEEFIMKWKSFLNVIDKKENNWGNKLGGRAGYQTIVNRYGLTGLKKNQALGGRNAGKTKEKLSEKSFKIDLGDPIFLEFYGALFGDGWLSKIKSRNKIFRIIGLCGNLKLDKEFILHCRKNIFKLINRTGYIEEKRDNNTLEFKFGHKQFFIFLSETLKFPIGIKNNLEIHPSIYSLGYEKIRHVIRGIFDTDGSFYLEKNKKGVPSYPCISIHMMEPKLMKQIVETLRLGGFSVIFEESNCQLRLKGHKQLLKWMNEIGSSNPKHLNKIAPVAQPG